METQTRWTRDYNMSEAVGRQLFSSTKCETTEIVYTLCHSINQEKTQTFPCLQVLSEGEVKSLQ